MASTAVTRTGAQLIASREPETWISFASWPFVIGCAATAESAVAAALTLFVPGVLRGPAVMNGSARGTAAVVLFVAVPILALSLIAAARGSVRAVVTDLGAAAYLVYNAVLFLFATPINELFLLYVAMFGLSFWTIATTLHAIDPPTFARHFSVRLAARPLAVAIAVIATLNGLAWLVRIVPALIAGNPGSLVVGTGVETSPVYVQDLSFWVPLMFVTAVWAWRRRPWGLLLLGVLLLFGLIESISIAVDQWMGSAADPASTVASAALTPVFGVAAALLAVLLVPYFRRLNAG